MKNEDKLRERGAAFDVAWRNLNQDFNDEQDLTKFVDHSARWRIVDNDTKDSTKVLTKLGSFAKMSTNDTANLSIGHSIRFHIIRAETCESPNTSAFFEKLRSVATNNNLGLGNSSNYARALNPYEEGGPAADLPDILKLACVHMVNEKLRFGKLPLLGLKDIFEDDFCGPDALIDFAHFLRGEERRVQPFIEKLNYGVTGQERENLESWITKKLHAQSNGPVLCNVYSKRMWCGLSAFGTWLAQKLTRDAAISRDERINLYLPVGRFWNSDPDMGSYDAPGYRIFLGRLRHFYCEETRDLAHAKAISPMEDISMVLHEIRKGMIERPRILILNGVYTKKATKSVAGIERFIASDMALDILSVILDPALCSFETTAEIETFNRNRIVVLSNEALTDADIWSAPHPNVNLVARPLPEPNSDDVPDILRSHKLSCVEQVLEIRTDYPELTRLWQDAEYHLLGCFLNLRERDGNSAIHGTIARLLSAQNDFSAETGFIRPLMDEILGAIPKKKALLNKLLFMIASAPDGLRRSTLQRLAHFSLNGRQEHGWIEQGDIDEYAQHAETDKSRVEVIELAIQDLLESFEGVLRLDTQDFYAGVDTLAHALEFEIATNIQSAGSTERRSPSTIVFVSPILREVARDALVEECGRKTFHFCHRILAEDALLQQAVALRHAQTHESQSIYHWRRQITGIYHGLCSLPLTKMDNSFVKFDSSRNNASQHPALTPNRPRAFWRWLYLFAYRRMIEQPPIYAMSRIYGRDRLKRDILMAFSRPWDLWPDEMKRKSNLNRPSEDLFFSDYTQIARKFQQTKKQTLKNKLQQRAVVARAFHFSLFQSNHILGDIAAMRVNLETLNSYPAEHEDISLCLSVLKRRLDLESLQLTPIQDIDLNIYEMGDALDLALTPDSVRLIENVIENSTAGYLECLLGRKEHEELPDPFSKICGTIQSELPESLGSTVGGIASVADILFRIAENHATQADCSYVPEQLLHDNTSTICEELEQELKQRATSQSPADKFQMRCTRSIATPVDLVVSFSQAHALFMLAEALRLSSFAAGPLSGKFFASGHAMRTMIRVGLKLEAIRRRILDLKAEPLTRLGPFGTRIRRDSDTMTRHMFRYPRERASQLVTEAAILRLLIGENATEQTLMIARNLLSRAEPDTAALSGHSRHRFRLAVERGELHRQLALTALALAEKSPIQKEQSIEKVKFYAQLAEWDLLLLKAALEKNNEISILQNIYSRQKIRLDELQEKI